MNIETILKELTLEEKAALCSGADFWHTKPVERLDIPQIMVSDGPHGLRKNREGAQNPNEAIEAVCFPSASALACSFDRGLLKELGKALGEECRAENVSVILGPGCNIKRSPLCGRNFEYFSEDPYLASQMAEAHITGVQSMGVGTSLKHFAANNQESRRMSVSANIDERTLHEIYLAAFESVVKNAKPWTVMCSYNKINGEYSSQNKLLLTDILRDDWGFGGLVMSDWGAVDDRAKAIRAGLDLEMPASMGKNDAAIVKAVESGELSEEELDNCVRRVLELIQRGSEEKPQVVWDKDRHHKLAAKIAENCAVLLKNDGVLPIAAKGKKIAVIGPHAGYARKMFGGYTHMCMMESTYAIANSIAGVSGVVQADADEIITVPGTNIQSDETEQFDQILKRQKPQCRNLYEEFQIRFPESEILYAYGYPIAGNDESHFEEALQAAKQADIVILTLGGKHGTCSMASMGEGIDSTDINLPKCQDAFIRKAAQLGKPLVGVHFDGRPISSDAAEEYLDAILEAWSPSETGAEAVVDILTGIYNPGGKLPVTVAYGVGQLPVYYNHPYGSSWDQSGSIGFANYVNMPHRPRYYFGYGLSYTTFTYSDLHISMGNEKAADTVQISCAVENTGSCEGDEVVQLYLRDEYASLTRPVKELAGFKRIHLRKGEKKTVCFEVKTNQMAFLDIDMHWKVEKGRYAVEVGSSSEDIRLRGSYCVKENKWVAGRNRAFWASAAAK